MRPYQNLSGKSGVTAYELAPGAITIQFGGGAVYRYTEASAGRAKLETMCRLAQAGRGLSTFIAREVRRGYAERLG